MPIDTRPRTSLVTETVARYITTNKLTHGDRLPSESEMAKLLGVSRNTIREAYISLEQEGTILRKHGIGTIVIRTSLTNVHYSLSRSFPLLIRESGRTVSFKHDKRYLAPANNEAMAVFDLGGPTDLFCASRVICADGLPAIFHIDYFRPDIRESDLNWDFFNGDMVDLLEVSLNEQDFHYQTRIEAELLDEKVATLLERTPGTPDIALHAVIYSSKDMKPITCTLTYHNSKVLGFTLSGTLKGSGSVFRETDK